MPDESFNKAVAPPPAIDAPATAPCREPLLAWPGWRHLGYFVYLGLLQTLWFWLVYGGANFVTAHRALRLRIHLDLEQRIPFVPEAVVVYLSIFAMFYTAPFILRSRQQLRALAAALAVVTLCAGICFLLFPAQLGFSAPREFGALADLYHFADWLNLDYNLAPSLHVAMSFTCAGAFATRASVTGKLVLWAWAVAIAASTLVTYQHHLVDAVTGFALGIAALKLVYARMTTDGRASSF